MQELDSELSEFKASRKLIKEIDEAYSAHFLVLCFSGLPQKKQFSQKSADLMIQHWIDISGLMQYIQKNYEDDWGAIYDIIQLNLTEELMNAHYDLQNF